MDLIGWRLEFQIDRILFIYIFKCIGIFVSIFRQQLSRYKIPLSNEQPDLTVRRDNGMFEAW